VRRCCRRRSSCLTATTSETIACRANRNSRAPEPAGCRLLRAQWATGLLEAGAPVHEVSARLGHVDLRTTARYGAPRPERVDEIAEVLDRRHHAVRRAGWGR